MDIVGRSRRQFTLRAALTGSAVALVILIGGMAAVPQLIGMAGQQQLTSPKLEPEPTYGTSETADHEAVVDNDLEVYGDNTGSSTASLDTGAGTAFDPSHRVAQTGAGAYRGNSDSLIPLSMAEAASGYDDAILFPSGDLFQRQSPVLADRPEDLAFLITKTSQVSDGWESQSIFSHLTSGDTDSPQFWEVTPRSPAVSLIEVGGEEEISIYPGPDDQINVIIQLKRDPVGIAIARAYQGATADGAGYAQIIREYQQETLAGHVAVLEDMENEDLEFVRKQVYSYIFNGIAGSIRMADLPALARLPQVERVYRDYRVHIDLEDSVPLIGAPQVWALQDSKGRSATGHGIVVAVVDTGIDYTHPDLGGCLGPSCRVIGGYDFVNNDADPIDDQGHGTHVAGIVGASGVTTGVAPDVSFLAYKVLNRFGSGSFSDVIAGIERAANPDGDPDTDDGADVINLSLGGSGDPDDPVSQAVDAAVDLGVAVVISAGNSGSRYQTIGSPGVARKAITVGAADDNDNIASFSSRGPVPGEWAIKPDIIAPGVSILSTVPSGVALGDPSGYRKLSGTSMSAPHIAGAAALIKQLHPTWTPEMVKANLMNTALRLNYDVYIQGAGRVRVYHAAQAHAILSPGSISLGLDDLAQDLWQASRTLTITNISGSSVTYNVTVEHSLPTGVVVTADPASVTLASGESKPVQFSLSVDNTIVPNPSNAPYSYEGAVVASSGDEILRVPFSFIKSPVINFSFDESPWIVWVHNRSGKVHTKYFPGTSLQLPVSTGSYDAVVTYGDVATRVFKEGILVETGADVVVNKADAIHDVIIAPVDIRGNPLPVIYGGEQLEHKDTGVWQRIIFYFPTKRRFSDISGAYSWEWIVTRSVKSKEPVYDFNGFANSGVTGDLLFQNQPSDLKHMAFHYAAPPEAKELLVRHWSSAGPKGGSSFVVYNTSRANSIKEPFVRDEYFMPIPYPDFPFAYFFEEVFPFDTGDGGPLWDSQIARTPYFLAKDTSTVEGYLLGASEAPVITADSSEMRVTLPPPNWFGRFDNTETAVRLKAARGSLVWLFLNQMQDMTPHTDLRYGLYQNNVLVKSGDLVGAGNPWYGPSSISIPVGPGVYTMKVVYDKYHVRGHKGAATLSATFDTGAADKDPPAMLNLRVLSSSGEATDGIPPTATGQLRVTFTEVLSQLPVLSYRTGNAAPWSALSVTDLGSGDYTAGLPNLPNNSVVSLRIQAQDTVANSLDYRVVPAYVVALDAPAPLAPTDGFVTGDSDITFEWAAVDTAADYRIQIATGDNFGPSGLIEGTGSATQYTTTLSKGAYYWRVMAVDSQQNGSPWSAVWRVTVADPVVKVTTHTGGDFSPAMMQAADGALWTVWQSCRSYCGIWYKTGDADGSSWSQAVRLSSQSYHDFDPSIAQTTGGRIFVAWDSNRNTNPAGVWNTDIYYKTSDDYGATWSADALLTTHTGDDGDPSITQTIDGKIWVVWASYRSGNYDLWYKISDDVGITWSDEVRLTTYIGLDWFPSITQTSDGKIWLVWARGFSIYYRTSDDGGVTWSAETRLTSGFALYPSIAQTPDGRIWVAWSSFSNANPAGVWSWEIVYKSSGDGLAAWSSEKLFTRYVGDDIEPGLTASASGDMALVWASPRSVNYDIWYGIIGRLEDVSPPPHVQFATHKPYPNPDSDDAITITARVLDETGIASAELVWSVGGVSTADLTMYDDGQHGDTVSGDGIYGVQLAPLPVGTSVSYQVRAKDAEGNAVLGPLTPRSFTVLKPFVVASDILFIFDARNSSNWDAYYRNALKSLGLSFDFWNGSLRGLVDKPVLNEYKDGLVIWAMPDWGYLADREGRDMLAAYLEGGGKLFITGQDLGYFFGRTGFYKDYLHAKYVQDDTNIYALKGVTGDPIADSLSLVIKGGDGANNQHWPSEIDPVSPAVSILTYDDTVPTAAELEPQSPTAKRGPELRFQEGPASYPGLRSSVLSGGLSERQVESNKISSSGTGALRVKTNKYALVYFAFGFEAINTPGMREQVMRKVLAWLDPSIFKVGSMRGVVDLQGRTDNGGARVSLVGTNVSALTKPDGSFLLTGVSEGTYEIKVTLPTYLPATKSSIVVTTAVMTELPQLLLRGGDFNMDGWVNVLDLLLIARNLNRSASVW